MEKKRLFKILSRAESTDVIQLGEKIQNKYPVMVIKKPEKALAMIKMREPVQNSLFYLGEVIISEAAVSIDGTVGRAAMGDDFDKTLNMAVIDAACNKGIFEDEKLLLEWETKQNELIEKENAMLQKTKVDFHSMDSEVTA
jgi:alpha-D-ribose 1-methylphosphonate 5-triphosphate synthase subunit PhnG